jgi:mannose-6-phosphate isomerase-like protein (cupin superfamily)
MKILALSVCLSGTAWGGDGGTPEAVFVSRSQAILGTPRFDYPGIMRIWWLESAADASTRLLEVNGTIELHYHPDVDHRMVVLDGELIVRAGAKTVTLKAGDFVFIPRLMPHSISLPKGIDRAHYLTIDTPVPSDPKKTVWIGPRPGSTATSR